MQHVKYTSHSDSCCGPDFMMEMFGKQQTNSLQFELWVEVTDYLHQSRVAGIQPPVAEGTAATVL